MSLVIEAENTLDQKMEVPIKYYLPQEIIPDYIVEKADFDLKFDPSKNQFFLEKNESFEPNEKKKFNIVIKNIWIISEELINNYLKEAGDLNEKLQKGAYAQIASSIFNEIKRNAAQIVDSQRKSESIMEYISNFKGNQICLENIKDDLDKLRNLTKEQKKEEELAKNKIKNVLRDINVLEKLKRFSDTLLKGKLSSIGVWKIILFIISFVIILTTFFYTVWFINLKKEEKRQIKKVDTEVKKPETDNKE